MKLLVASNLCVSSSCLLKQQFKWQRDTPSMLTRYTVTSNYRTVKKAIKVIRNVHDSIKRLLSIAMASHVN